MAETTTVNYGWTKPDPGASPNTWGATQNATVDKVDAKVFANEQGLVPIGAITMFGGAVAPANWLLCNGQSLPTTGGTYDKLFAALQYAHGGSGANFNIPNMNNKLAIGAGVSALGAVLGSGVSGGWTYTIALANLPVHNHPASQAAHTHAVSQDPHTHAASQPAHTHGDQGHGHPDAGSYQDAHTHGGVLVSAGVTGAVPAGIGFVGNVGRTDAQQPALHIGVGTGYANLAAAQPAITVDTRQPAVHCDTQTPVVTVGNTGSGTPISLIPPSVALNFIVRYA